MVLTAPTLLILLILGTVQLAAGVLLGRMLPQTGRCRETSGDRAAEASVATSNDEVTALIEQRLARLIQLTTELHGRLQAVEEQLAMPVASGLSQDATPSANAPARLVDSLQSKLAEITAG